MEVVLSVGRVSYQTDADGDLWIIPVCPSVEKMYRIAIETPPDFSLGAVEVHD